MQRGYSAAGYLFWRLARPLIDLALRRSRRCYAIIRCGEEYLLVKNIVGSDKWRLPGGGAKRDESGEDAVVRELQEELGLQLDKENLVHHSDLEWRGRRHFIYTYKMAKKPKIQANKLEIRDFSWAVLTEVELDDSFRILQDN